MGDEFEGRLLNFGKSCGMIVDSQIIAKWFHEFHARRRLKGKHFLITAVFKF